MTVTRAPLACSAAPCSRTLKPGEYKRIPPRTPLAVGYFFACAACGFVGAFSVEELDPGEQADIVCPGRVRLVSIRGVVQCYSCKCVLSIEGDDMTATPKG